MTEAPLRKFKFLPEIERQALVVIAKDMGFMIKWKGRLKPEHWNEMHIVIIFKAIDKHVAKYNELPNLGVISQYVNDEISTFDNADHFQKYLFDLFNSKFETAEAYAKDCLMDHMKAVDYDNFLIKTAGLINDGEHEEISKLLNEISIRHTLTVPQPAYVSVKEDSVEARVALSLNARKGISTPWPTFNRKHGGGFHPSTLGCFMGSTGSGKSVVLVNVGSHCVLSGLNVYHFTFELDVLETKSRYDVCLTGASFTERKARPGVLDNALQAMKNRGKLYVIQHPTGTCTANMIRGSINDYVLMGAPKPDAIIVDYLSIMSPNNPDNVDMKKDYVKLKQIAEELRAMAMDLDVPVISALQANRGAVGKDKINKEDAADSYAIIHILDWLLTLNQSEAEKQMGKLRIYTAKVRSYEDQYTVLADVNYDNMRVSENGGETMNYNAAVATMQKTAADKHRNSGVLAPMPPVVTPESPFAATEAVLGMAAMPVKEKPVEEKLTQAEVAEGMSWGLGHRPPPIAALDD